MGKFYFYLSSFDGQCPGRNMKSQDKCEKMKGNVDFEKEQLRSLIFLLVVKIEGPNYN